jgi:hypothetical protein
MTAVRMLGNYPRKRMSSWLAIAGAAAFVAAFWPAERAAAQGSQPNLDIVANATFAPNSDTGSTTELSIYLHNTGSVPLAGSLRVVDAFGGRRMHASTPFRTGAGDKILLQLAQAERAPNAQVQVVLDDGRVIAGPSLSEGSYGGYGAPGLAVALGSEKIALGLRTASAGASSGSSRGMPSVNVVYPVNHGRTKELVFPRTLAGYGGIDLVVIDTEHLLAQTTEAAATMRQWVRNGGELAVVVSREEDLASPRLTEFAHGTIRADHEPPTRVLLERGSTYAPTPADAPVDPTLTVDPTEPPLVPPTTPTLAPKPSSAPGSTIAPARASVASSSYTGGLLERTAFGTHAEFGHGGITFLALDLTLLGEEPWLQRRIFDLVTKAHEQHKSAFAQTEPLRRDRDSGTKRQLDPNEHYAIALGICALVLIAYALIVGPYVFLRAKRRSKLFEPFTLVPAAAAVAFLLIVGVGILSRGVRSSVRRITLIDLGSGVADASAIRYRGFNLRKTNDVALFASATGSTLMLTDNQLGDNAGGTINIAQAADSITGLHAPPWSTTVVKELIPQIDIGEIKLQTNPDGTVTVTNQTKFKLSNLLVHDGTGRFGALRELDAGAAKIVKHNSSSLVPGTNENGLRNWEITNANKDPNITEALRTWTPHEDLLSETKLWSIGQPSLLATVEGMPYPEDDSGYHVGRDRVFIRAVGARSFR